MSSFILVPYYNIIPSSVSTYFTIIDNTLVVTLNDVFNNPSQFLTNSINKLIYIFNGPNMGTFKINSLKIKTDKTYTFLIKLNSIPPNLRDNTNCVLSLNPSVYTIDRTFSSTSYNNLVGNFTLENSNTILINKFSTGSDDTLFLYILITNKSFNIINNNSSASYVINDIIISKNQPSGSFISLNATIPIMALINGSTYEFNISTDDASTLSNLTLNNTNVSPITDATVTLPTNNPSPDPLNSAIKTHVTIPHSYVDNSNNINIKKPTLYKDFNSVLLTYQTNKFYNNGYFSLTTNINNDIIDLYTNVSNYPLTEHLDNYSFKDLPVFSKEPPPVDKSKDVDYKSTITTAYNRLRALYNKMYADVKKNTDQLLQDNIQDDPITNIPILPGNRYTLSLSLVDSFKKPVNFIKQQSILFISSGTNVYKIATKKIPIYKKNGNDSIIECNVILNKLLPEDINNKTYLLSNAPVLPYVTFEYLKVHNVSDVIGDGKFNILTISKITKFPTMIISNTDILYNNNVSSFNKLLYTIAQDPTKPLAPPYLNILNTDYSIVSTLAILQVVPDQIQTTFTYTIVSGSQNLELLVNGQNYIFTLFQPLDIISDTGILNLTQKNRPMLTDVNNIIQSAKVTIDKMILNNPNDTNLINAKNIIQDTSNLSSLIINIPLTNDILDTYSSLLANTYNAIQYALIFDPRNSDLLLIIDYIKNFNIPIIIISLLEYVSQYIKKSLENNPNDVEISNLDDHVKSSIILFKSENTGISISGTIKELLSRIDKASAKYPSDTSLVKARRMVNNILNNMLNPNPSVNENMTMDEDKYGNLIETLDNVKYETNENSDHYYIIMIILLIIFLIYIMHNYSNKK